MHWRESSTTISFHDGEPLMPVIDLPSTGARMMRSIGTISLAAIPMSALVHGLTSSQWSVWATAVFAAILVLIEWRRIAGGVLRASIALLCITLALLPFAATPFLSVERGLQMGGIIASLILTVTLLSRAALRSEAIHTVMPYLFALTNRRKYVALSVACQLFGGMLGLAGVSMLMELAAKDRAATREDRISTFAAITRGYAGASLWSPMFSNISIMIAMYPGANWIMVLPLAMLVALATILIGTALQKSVPVTVPVRQLDATSSSIRTIAHRALPIVASMTSFLAFVVGTSHFLKIQVSTVIVVISPMAAWGLNLAFSRAKNRLIFGSKLFIQDFRVLKQLVGEVLLFMVSGCAGTVIADAIPRVWTAPIGIALSQYPVVACLFLTCSVILLSCAAVHPLLSAILIATCFPSDVMGLPLLPHLCAILVGWAMAVILTPFSMVSLMASRFSGIPILIISMRSNLLFASTSVLASSFLLGGISIFLHS